MTNNPYCHVVSTSPSSLITSATLTKNLLIKAYCSLCPNI